MVFLQLQSASSVSVILINQHLFKRIFTVDFKLFLLNFIFTIIAFELSTVSLFESITSFHRCSTIISQVIHGPAQSLVRSEREARPSYRQETHLAVAAAFYFTTFQIWKKTNYYQQVSLSSPAQWAAIELLCLSPKTVSTTFKVCQSWGCVSTDADTIGEERN